MLKNSFKSKVTGVTAAKGTFPYKKDDRQTHLTLCDQFYGESNERQ